MADPIDTEYTFLPDPCPICGGKDGRCTWTKGSMGQVPNLTYEDWERIYNFMTQIELPFLHQVIHEADMRNRKR